MMKIWIAVLLAIMAAFFISKFLLKKHQQEGITSVSEICGFCKRGVDVKKRKK